MSRIPIRLSAVSKYRARRERGYASRKEARRADELRLLLKLGEIRELREQVSFELIPGQGSEPAITYRADFVFEERQADGTWLQIVEDVKGVRTPVYRLKKRLMQWRHGIAIREA